MSKNIPLKIYHKKDNVSNVHHRDRLRKISHGLKFNSLFLFQVYKHAVAEIALNFYVKFDNAVTHGFNQPIHPVNL